MRKGSFDQRSLGHFLILRNQLRTQRLDFSSGPLLERVGPWRLGLCQPMIDVVLGAGVFEGVRPDEFSSLRGGPEVRRRRARIAWGGEASSVVGEDGMDLVSDGGDRAAQEVPRGAAPALGGHSSRGKAYKLSPAAYRSRAILISFSIINVDGIDLGETSRTKISHGRIFSSISSSQTAPPFILAVDPHSELSADYGRRQKPHNEAQPFDP